MDCLDIFFTDGKLFVEHLFVSDPLFLEKNTFKNVNIDGATIPDSVRDKFNEQTINSQPSRLK